MPIVLGATPTGPRWNSYLLFIVWLLQFILIAYVEFVTFVSLAFMGLFGSKSNPGEQLYVIPFQPWNREVISPNDIADKTSLAVIALLFNFAILATIPYEAYVFATGNLSTQKFYHLQLVKSLYLGVLAFIILCIMGWSAFGWVLLFM
jgi:hypothetical protein